MVLVDRGSRVLVGFLSRVNAASPGRQAGGQISVVVGLELLAGRERRARFSADIDQTLAGFEAGQGLGAW